MQVGISIFFLYKEFTREFTAISSTQLLTVKKLVWVCNEGFYNILYSTAPFMQCCVINDSGMLPIKGNVNSSKKSGNRGRKSNEINRSVFGEVKAGLGKSVIIYKYNFAMQLVIVITHALL